MGEISLQLKVKIENAKAGLVVARAGGDLAKEIWFLGCLAFHYWDAKEFSEVIRFTPPLLPMLSELEDTVNLRLALLERLAGALARCGQLEAALVYLEEQQSLLPQTGDFNREAWNAARLSEHYWDLRRRERALPHLVRGADLYARLGKHYESCELRHRLALFYMERGHLTLATRHFFLALIEADLCGDLEYQSYICFNLAMIYVELGKWEGLSYYKQALAYFRKRGDTTNYKITLKKLRLARARLRAIGVAP
jgi:tetratricopeptide (TPR) repeat protein